MKKLLLIISLVLAVTASAQTQKRYNLGECRDMAMAHNARIKMADNDALSAMHGKKEALANFFPSLSVGGGGMKASDCMIKMDMGPQSMEMLDGGWYANAMASLPIYAGGRIFNGYKMAKLGVEISEIQRIQTANEVRLTVDQYYWQIVALTEKVHTLESARCLLDTIQREVANAVKAGITKPNDLLQVNLRLNDNRSAYIDVENNIGVLKMLLAQCMGLDTDSLELAIDMEHPLESPESLFVNHADAVLATTEYRLLDKSVEAARLQKKITLGEFLPTVSISGGYMFQNFMGPSQNSLMGLVTVSIPISWKAPHTMKKQKLACENAITRLNDGQEQLVIRMRKSQNDLCNAYQQAILAKKSIEQAAENLRLNENYYKAGISTMSDLLEAQTLFQQSKDRYSEAYSTYEIKKTEYLISTGR